MTNCKQCGGETHATDEQPASETCSAECSAKWDDEHPEYAAGWIKVEDLTAVRREELDVLLSQTVRDLRH